MNLRKKWGPDHTEYIFDISPQLPVFWELIYYWKIKRFQLWETPANVLTFNSVSQHAMHFVLFMHINALFLWIIYGTKAKTSEILFSIRRYKLNKHNNKFLYQCAQAASMPWVQSIYAEISERWKKDIHKLF